jgi:hypothetical protein
MSRLDIPMPEEGFGHRAGDRLVTCHPDDAEDNEYREFETEYKGTMTMVPRSRVTGGILGFLDPGDRKYGKGVTKRKFVEEELVAMEGNFRPDGKECPSV